MNVNPASLPVAIERPGLVSFWDFQEPAGSPFVARGPFAYVLQERDGTVERVAGGVFGRQAVRFGGEGAWLCAPRAACPALDFHGPSAQMTVVAWIRRDPTPADLAWSCQFVAGMWNEHGRRQYGLFLNLRIWDSAEQVGAHVSHVGGPTPGYKYCMDAALGATPVPFSVWQCVAASYDGAQARAYLGGRLDARAGRNPHPYPGGLFDGGPDGADFTVGAVARPETVTEDFREVGHVVANRYRGLLGGLAVYGCALAGPELLDLAAPDVPAARLASVPSASLSKPT